MNTQAVTAVRVDCQGKMRTVEGALNLKSGAISGHGTLFKSIIECVLFANGEEQFTTPLLISYDIVLPTSKDSLRKIRDFRWHPQNLFQNNMQKGVESLIAMFHEDMKQKKNPFSTTLPESIQYDTHYFDTLIVLKATDNVQLKKLHHNVRDVPISHFDICYDEPNFSTGEYTHLSMLRLSVNLVNTGDIQVVLTYHDGGLHHSLEKYPKPKMQKIENATDISYSLLKLSCEEDLRQMWYHNSDLLGIPEEEKDTAFLERKQLKHSNNTLTEEQYNSLLNYSGACDESSMDLDYTSEDYDNDCLNLPEL